jgi:hypothetical protein
LVEGAASMIAFGIGSAASSMGDGFELKRRDHHCPSFGFAVAMGLASTASLEIGERQTMSGLGCVPRKLAAVAAGRTIQRQLLPALAKAGTKRVERRTLCAGFTLPAAGDCPASDLRH